MFKRKSTPPTVSPLSPPPAATSARNPNLSGNGQMTPAYHPSGGPGGPEMSSGSGPATATATGPRLNPGFNGGAPVNRVGSYDSGTAGSGKSEKRRSGLFGFGKKDKGAEKEKESVRNRASFSVDRAQMQNQAEGGSDFQPYRMRQYPPPGDGQQIFPPQGNQGQRVVSSPNNPTAPNDLNPSPSTGQMTKSQSMNLVSKQGYGGVPDTHPYRGFLNAQQDRDAPGPPQGQGQLQSPPLGSGPAQGGLPRVTSNQKVQSQASGGLPRSSSNQGSNSSPRKNSLPRDRSVDGGLVTSSIPRLSSGPAGLGEIGGDSWLKEFDPVVELISAQPTKTYVASPPQLEMILARTSAGGQPKQGQPGSASNDWDEVWLQLSGISLSMWSLKETRAAAAQNQKVPPTYFNITDSSLELLAPLPPPPHRPTSHPHHYVFSLNTAGSNRLLFSCPSERELARWATGLRLAAWERARLEEIYTGHLIKAGGREPKVDLVRGKMEGWVRVRVMGGTDWKRLWMVLSNPSMEDIGKDDDKKGRRKSFFGLGGKDEEPVNEPNTGVSMASFYTEQRTPKNKTTGPTLNIWNVTQAHAVFPERLEVMTQSNLMKVVGKIGGEMVTIEGRLRDSGWALVMPEAAEGVPAGSTNPLTDMLRWVTGIHDVFGLYGRPVRYIWDREDPKSLFFAYPEGEDRNSLFLGTDDAMLSDFRTSQLAAIRSQFVDVVSRRLAGPNAEYRNEDGEPTPRVEGNFRLPPLPFNESPHMSDNSVPRSLTPITERTDLTADPSRQNSTRTAKSNFLYSSERQLSTGSQKGTRQESGSSTKQDDRLAPIADSSEMLAQYTDEPDDNREPHENPPQQQQAEVVSPAQPTPTTQESGTVASMYSQSSGITPTRSPHPQSAASQPGLPSIEARPAQAAPVSNTQSPPVPEAVAADGQQQPKRQQQQPPPQHLQQQSVRSQRLSQQQSVRPQQPQSLSRQQPQSLPQPLSQEQPQALPQRQPEPVPQPQEEPSPQKELSQQPSPQQQRLSQQQSVPSTVYSTPQQSRSGSKELSPITSRSGPSLGLAAPLGSPISPSTSVLSPTPRRVSSVDSTPSSPIPGGSAEEPAAMYLMSMVEEERHDPRTQAEPQPSQLAQQTQQRAARVPFDASTTNDSTRVRPTINTSFETGPRPVQNRAPASDSLGRKPSGARAIPAKKSSGSSTLQPISDERKLDEHPSPSIPSAGLHSTTTQTDFGEDATTFMAFADQPSPVKPTSGRPQQVATMPPVAEVPTAQSGDILSVSPGTLQTPAQRAPPGEQAGTEKQRAIPRPEVRQHTPVPPGGREVWSDEDEGEDEVEESPVVVQRQSQMAAPSTSTRPSTSIREPSTDQSQPRPSPEQFRGQPSTEEFGGQPSTGLVRQHPQRVASQTRALPPVPRPQEQRMLDDDAFRQLMPPPVQRPPSRSPAPPVLPSALRPASNPTPPPGRQSVWNANFSANHGMPQSRNSTKFVDLDEPSAQLTKAFSPHGLLQAGIQDKEDRSAKRQEEAARETGNALINVPSKPPPPQTGLLGAVAAHEASRRNAGGIGATLTDRERDRRQAEDRQREFEKLQRQQMEQMRHFGGDQQGGQYPYGMNMGMMGMPPMSPYGYQGGYNPYAQHHAMMAAQMAYQQAMMAMSHQGSQGGEQDRASSPSGSMAAHSPGFRTSPPPVQYGGGGGGGGYGFNPHMNIPYGWPGAMPSGWGSPSPPPGPGSPGVGGWYAPQHPYNSGMFVGSGSSTTFDDRSRNSMHLGEGRNDGRSEGRNEESAN